MPGATWAGMRTFMLMLGLMLLGCPHVRATERTAAEHRSDAARHQEAARNAREQVVTDGSQLATLNAPGRQPAGQPDAALTAYTPRQEHLEHADRELREANEHLAAAKSLLAFEDEACAGLSAGERSSCPLFASTVSRVEPTREGFTLAFRSDLDADQSYRRLRCHLAYANARGFDRPSCPLFVKGTRLEAVKPVGIAFVGESPEVAELLRAQARRVFLGMPAMNSSATP